MTMADKKCDVCQPLPEPPPEIVVLTPGDPEKLYNTIADAVGEPRVGESQKGGRKKK